MYLGMLHAAGLYGTPSLYQNMKKIILIKGSINYEKYISKLDKKHSQLLLYA